MSEVRGTTVIRAIRDLHGRTAKWPTMPEIAAHLDVPEDDVRPLLKDLYEARIFRPRQRNRRRVWMPWDQP